MRCKITKTDQGYSISGMIDESFDDVKIDANANPLVLDFAEVMNINSIGVQKFVSFTDKWKGRKVVYTNLTSPMVDAVIMLPAMLGPEENTASIESLVVPYRDPKIDQVIEVMLSRHEIGLQDGELVFPVKSHPKRGHDMKADETAQEHQLLVDAGALKILDDPA